MAEKLEDGATPLSKGVATTLPLAAAILGVFGIKDGTLSRIILNAGIQFFAALLLVFIGIFLAAWAVSAGSAEPGRDSTRQRKRKQLLDSLAIALFVGGVTVVGYLAVVTTGENERPRITGKVSLSADGVPTLDATVSAEGLRTEEHVLIRVLGASTRAKFRKDRTGRSVGLQELDQTATIPDTQLLFATRTGPDRDGKVDRSFALPLTPGLYDVVDVQAVIIEPTDKNKEPAEAPVCNEASLVFGCLSVWLPQPSTSPQLAVTWEPGAGTQVLSVSTKAGGIPAEGGVSITVLGRAKVSSWSKPIHTSLLSPLPLGTIDVNFKVPLTSSFSKVCVVASMFDHLGPSPPDSSPEHTRCPVVSKGESVVRMSVPRPSERPPS